MKIAEYLPPMLDGEVLNETVMHLPVYTREIIEAPVPQRLLALNDIYEIYIPTDMTREIYTRLYMAMYRSLQRKDTKEAIIQANHNFRMKKTGVSSSSVIGGSDCLTIIGDSGIGKSRAISEVLKVIAGDNQIETEKPFRKVVPCISVQTPFDSSVKSLLLEILKEADLHLETNFYDQAIRSKATTDVLIMTVSQVALEHLGMIVVDEIQNVIKAKQGRNLVGCLTQLINYSGIAIVMVGTPECIDFFESEMYLGRRAVGLRYGPLKYNETFQKICEYLFSLYYVRQAPILTEDLCAWLWSKTQGNISALIGMIAGAQELAILSGREELNKEALQEAYDTRLASLQVFLRPKETKQTARKKKETHVYRDVEHSENSMKSTYAEIVNHAKRQSLDAMEHLQGAGLIEVIDA